MRLEENGKTDDEFELFPPKDVFELSPGGGEGRLPRCWVHRQAQRLRTHGDLGWWVLECNYKVDTIPSLNKSTLPRARR